MSLRHSLLSLALLAGLAVVAPVHADEAADLAKRAQTAYQSRDFARSADLYLQAATTVEAPALFYNAACAFALAGGKDQAFAALQRAIETGWENIDLLRKDTDLSALHDDARWAPLLAVADRAVAQRERMWGGKAIASDWQATLTEDQRIAGLSRAWSEAKFNFVNFDLVPDLDWDAAYLAAMPKVRAAKTNEAYFHEMQAFYALLNDGHTSVFVQPEASDAWMARPGVDTLWLEERVIVRQVFDPALQAAGLQPGWEIVEVDGLPVRDYVAKFVAPYISASTPQDRAARQYERFLFAGRLDAPVRATARDLQGKSHALVLPRMAQKPRTEAAPNVAPFEWKMLPGNVAWVALRSFGDDTAAIEYLKHFDEIAKADAIVFDIRDNGGGNSSVGYTVLATIADKPFKTSAWRTRDYRPAYRAWKRGEGRYGEGAETIQPDAAHRFDKPVFVLTSARTYSAAEDFAVAFDTMQRGRIVGEATGGSTGQPLIIDLPGGVRARICTKRDTYSDGREFVGVGVQPQVVVHPTVTDFRAGRDTVLEAALKLRGDYAASSTP